MELTFEVTGVRPVPNSVAPAVLFALRITQTGGAGRVHALALRVQVQIDARRRRYTADEQHRLYEVFGEPAAWDRSLRPLVCAHAAMLVPAFDEAIEVELPVACTYDFEVVSAKYLHAIREGAIPLIFLFSGTAFLAGGPGMAIEPVAWDRQAVFQMPAERWRTVMDAYFPDSAWIRISRDTLDALHAYRGRQAAPDWDRTLDALLQAAAVKEPA